jgi:hypothetical protein
LAFNIVTRPSVTLCNSYYLLRSITDLLGSSQGASTARLILRLFISTRTITFSSAVILTAMRLPDSLPRQSFSNFWWTKWHWYRFFSDTYDFPLSICIPHCSILIRLAPEDDNGSAKVSQFWRHQNNKQQASQSICKHKTTPCNGGFLSLDTG